jgi:hypothetical protein
VDDGAQLIEDAAAEQGSGKVTRALAGEVFAGRHRIGDLCPVDPDDVLEMRKRDLLNREHRRGRLVGRLAGVGGFAPALSRFHPANGKIAKSQTKL